MGYYISICESLSKDPKKEHSDKIKSNLSKIIELINNFPRDNIENFDIFQEIEKIRNIFKKICALTKIDAFYPEVDNLSF